MAPGTHRSRQAWPAVFCFAGRPRPRWSSGRLLSGWQTRSRGRRPRQNRGPVPGYALPPANLGAQWKLGMRREKRAACKEVLHASPVCLSHALPPGKRSRPPKCPHCVLPASVPRDTTMGEGEGVRMRGGVERGGEGVDGGIMRGCGGEVARRRGDEEVTLRPQGLRR